MGEINSGAFGMCQKRACVLAVLPPAILERTARMKNWASEQILAVSLLATAEPGHQEDLSSGPVCLSQRPLGNYLLNVTAWDGEEESG